MANGLTGLQRAFVIEYCHDWNATRAAERAGYKGNYFTLAAIGCENLKKPKIANAISDRVAQLAMSKEECLHRLGVIARASLEDVLTIDEDGKWIIDIPKGYEEGNLYPVKSIRETQHGLHVMMESRLDALSQIAKAHGLLKEQHEVVMTAELVEKLDVTELSDDDLDRILAGIGRRKRRRAGCPGGEAATGAGPP